eukprot:2994297-Amphidinium_carterae.1
MIRQVWEYRKRLPLQDCAVNGRGVGVTVWVQMHCGLLWLLVTGKIYEVHKHCALEASISKLN